jgi:hypothetical protein
VRFHARSPLEPRRQERPHQPEASGAAGRQPAARAKGFRLSIERGVSVPMPQGDNSLKLRR